MFLRTKYQKSILLSQFRVDVTQGPIKWGLDAVTWKMQNLREQFGRDWRAGSHFQKYRHELGGQHSMYFTLTYVSI
jgi:hypothetical protein